MNNPLKSLFSKYCIKDTETFFIYACMARRRYMPDLINVEIKPFSKIAPTAGFSHMESFIIIMETMNF